MNTPQEPQQEPSRGWLVTIALAVFTLVNTYRLATVDGEWGLRQWAVLALTVGLLYLLWREYQRFKSRD